MSQTEAVQQIVHQRLEAEDLTKVLLPLGTIDPSQPHVPIFVSADLAGKLRVVVIFGQSVQSLGIIAHRVIGGQGGVNKGSMVSIVQAIKEQRSSPADSAAPGIILANTGQTWWWPEGKRPLDTFGRHAIPMASAVHWGRRSSSHKNIIPGNSSPEEHVRYMFEEVLPKLANEKAQIDIIDASDRVTTYLDSVWDKWTGRVSSLAVLDGYTNKNGLTSEGFKAFLNDVSATVLTCPNSFWKGHS